MSVHGKAIVVTGAARGLGAAYARYLAAAGADLVLGDLDGLTPLCDELAGAGHRVVPVTGSVADPAVAQELVAACVRTFGRIDGLLNNAGIRPEGLSWQEDLGTTRRTVEVNLLGTIFCGSAALAEMVQQRSGSVVNVSSRAQLGIEHSATYAATKGAVASLTYSWALDVPAGVRVNAIAPQARGTGTRRPGAIFRPEEPEPEAIAPLVGYLLGDAASGITGQVVRLVGRPGGLALGLMTHPREATLLTTPSSWDEWAIELAFRDRLAANLEPIGANLIPVSELLLDG